MQLDPKQIKQAGAADRQVMRWDQTAAAWTPSTEQAYGQISGRPPMALNIWRAGAPAASEYIGGGIAPYTFSISAANSTARSQAAATASSVFTINRVASNGTLTQLGTITFSSGGRLGVVSISTALVTTGDMIAIVAPSSVDTALVNLAFQLRE